MPYVLKYRSVPLTWGSSISRGFVFAWWKFYSQTQIRQADMSCGKKTHEIDSYHASAEDSIQRSL